MEIAEKIEAMKAAMVPARVQAEAERVLNCISLSPVEKVLGALSEGRGVYTIYFESTKDALKSSRTTGMTTPAHLASITTVKKSVFNCTDAPFHEVVEKLAKTDDKGKGSYVFNVAGNLLVYKGKTEKLAGQTYARVYRMKNTSWIKPAVFSTVNAKGEKMSEDEVKDWWNQYGPKDSGDAPEVYNIKTQGIIAIVKGTEVLYTRPDWNFVEAPEQE
jgi:hypothetical protein